MKAIFINAVDQRIEEVDIEDNIQAYYDCIGCRMFDVIRLNQARDVIYVDDEGMYNADHFFAWQDFMHPIAGNGLVLGTDNEGNSISPSVSLQEVERSVRFIDVEEALAMAEAADEEARRQAEESPFEVIHMSTADIIKSRAYTEESDPE